MTEQKAMRLAILIDAENVQPVHADLIFSSAQAMGVVTEREIYGAATALTSWVEPVLKYAIHPNLTIRAAKGKNSSDIALVIGAMDLVRAGNIDGVVIASSDSDFSSLSVRLRTAGLEVIGMGTDKANALWRTACSSFVVLEQPSQKPAAAAQQGGKSGSAGHRERKSAAQPKGKPAPAEPKENKPAPQQGAKPPAGSAGHRKRAAAIEQEIRRNLDSNGGRVMVNSLFTILNKLPDYRIDRQDAGKKPLNYLTSTFGDAFDFENTPDGKSWISTKGWQPPEPGEAPAASIPGADEAPPELPPELPVPEIEEILPGEPEEVSPGPDDGPDEAPYTEDEPPYAGEDVEADAPAPETDAPYAEAEAPEEAESPDSDDLEDADEAAQAELATRLLVEGGMDPEISASIVGILRSARDKRAAYNAIRRLYGNIEGRQYYNQAKEILESRS